MEAPQLQLFVSEHELSDGAKQILTQLRPDWNLTTVNLKVFTDGITNKLMGCFNPESPNDVLLIRVYGNKTDMLIDRRAETSNFKILHKVGLAPRLYATFLNGLVYEYVPGDVLTVETCRKPEIYLLVAKTMADMHLVDQNGTGKTPALWNKLEQFLKLTPKQFSDQNKQKRLQESFFSNVKLENELKFLKENLSQLENPTVFCHNDLLLANIIYNAEKNSVTFIDYEYASYNYQAYDLANHFNEYAGVDKVDYNLFPSADYQKQWLRTYLERYKGTVTVSEQEVEELFRVVEKFTLASHFFWGLWSLIQAEHSSIDFDFVNYAFERFGEYFVRKKLLFSC